MDEKIHILSKIDHHHHHRETEKQQRKEESEHKTLHSQKSLKSITTSLSRLETYFEDKLNETKKIIGNKFNTEIEKNNKKIKDALD